MGGQSKSLIKWVLAMKRFTTPMFMPIKPLVEPLRSSCAAKRNATTGYTSGHHCSSQITGRKPISERPQYIEVDAKWVTGKPIL